MIASIAADGVVLFHLAFVAFAVAGGLLALYRLRFALVHLPAAAWGIYAVVTGTICPLTPLEVALRQRAGEAGYDGGFIEHYLLPVLYPAGLTPTYQLWLGMSAIAINLAIYAGVLVRARRRREAGALSVRGESA